MAMWCIHPAKGSASGTGVYLPNSSDPFQNAVQTWQQFVALSGLSNDDGVFFAVGQTYVFGIALGNRRYILNGVCEYDDPGDSESEWKDYAKTLTSYPRWVTYRDYFTGENSAYFRANGIEFDASGWNPPRIIDSYTGSSSKMELVNCSFKNGIIGAYKAASGTAYIKTEQCTFENMSTAGVYASQCRVESDSDIYKNMSTGIGTWLLNGANGQASYVKKGTYYGMSEGIRIDGRSGDSALVQQCTFDNISSVGVNLTPSNVSSVVINSSIISRATYPTVEAGGSLTYKYSDIFDYDNAPQGTNGGNNIDENPDFVNKYSGNLRLESDSPCVNTGDPALTPDEEGNINMGSQLLGVEEMIEDSLRTFLLADTEISDLVGTRIYSVENPQKPTYPFINFMRTGGRRQYSMDGQSTVSPSQFEINCYDDVLEDARTLCDAVRTRLSGYSGAAGSGTIHGAFLNDTEDSYEKDTKKYIVSMDWDIWYRETT